MPKSKDAAKKRKVESDDDSSSDTSIEDAPVEKKAAKGKESTNEQGEPYMTIDRNRRVTIREFKGKTYIDIREYYEKDGKLLPGKKGISLSVSQYNNLKTAMTTLEKLL